ncbi:hypothetical protein [Blastopirellula retiformator]|uniref:Uncharacterized protein n=1 Tax=Blastopirellula retiformator TaxID=2527970 RepID=A0A5C5VP44_9BACT|nr:hypothetical protein [Blastopirellula retiformator]TWT39753.1 hypothetical protein Enr8_14550 [Blastopirellula retiformator]
MAKLVSPIASAALILFSLTVFGHVAGNYVGTRLKRRGTGSPKPLPQAEEDPLSDDEYAPRMQLGETTRISRFGYGVTAVMAILGAIAVVIAGSYWSPQEIWKPNVFALCLASGAALGGIGGLTIFHFAWQLFQSWRQAMRHSSSTTTRR